MEKGEATQVAYTSSVIFKKGRPPPPQGLELGNPRRLDEDEYLTRLRILNHRSPRDENERDREERERKSGLCVENGKVDSMTQGLGHSILIIHGMADRET
eukprot:1142339-Pelagomonas_calceolata.AAC.1